MFGVARSGAGPRRSRGGRGREAEDCQDLVGGFSSWRLTVGQQEAIAADGEQPGCPDQVWTPGPGRSVIAGRGEATDLGEQRPDRGGGRLAGAAQRVLGAGGESRPGAQVFTPLVGGALRVGHDRSRWPRLPDRGMGPGEEIVDGCGHGTSRRRV